MTVSIIASYMSTLPSPYPDDVDQIAEKAIREPIFAPTGLRNRRKAKCAKCEATLERGEGRQWAYSDQAHAATPRYRLSPSYYCTACHEYKLEIAGQQPEIQAETARIKVWTRQYMDDMGWHVRRQVTDIIRACELQGADVAHAIAERLPRQEKRTYGAVMALIRSTVAEICSGPVGGV
jgi:hypothetical protein